MKNILIEGDSIAYGNYDLSGGGWAQHLQRELMVKSIDTPDNPYNVDNRAKSGLVVPVLSRHTEADLAQLDDFGPTTVILQAGLNEAKVMPGLERPLVSMQKFGEHLLRFSDVTLDKGAMQVFVGPPPVDELRTRPIEWSGVILEDDMVEEYAAVMRETAEETGTPYIDTRELFTQADTDVLLSADGYHPNDAGHARIYQAVSEVLEALPD
jgi:lysophospholipase L1-like esterase